MKIKVFLPESKRKKNIFIKYVNMKFNEVINCIEREIKCKVLV